MRSIPCQVSINTVNTCKSKVPSSKDRCFLNDTLIIYYEKTFRKHSLYIPLDIIGGVNIINFEEAVLQLDSDPNYSPAFSYATKKQTKYRASLF